MLDGELPYSVKTDDSVWNLSDSKDGRVLEVCACQTSCITCQVVGQARSHASSSRTPGSSSAVRVSCGVARHCSRAVKESRS